MNAPPHNPFRLLQENASQLFTEISKRQSAQMNCKNGCFKCCEAEFSVFPGEALLIQEWFFQLAGEQKAELRRRWESKSEKLAPQCGFLLDGKCSVYDARPVICRTQGAPLRFEDRKEKAFRVTACELNFEKGENIPSSVVDWFDLDRLTELQSIAENFLEKSKMVPEDLLALKNKDGRIPLRVLRDSLQLF